MKYYKRELYLRKIRPFYKSDIIKVITGMRRCGKSCLMRLISEELLESGVEKERIVFLDLDLRPNRGIKTPEKLEAKLDELVPPDRFCYVFIDEVQNVKGFEEVVNSLNAGGNASVFITGSNSYLLSGELMTKLTGRYLEFEVFPLNFREYVGMKRMLGHTIGGDAEEFREYIRYGGFPKSLEFDSDEAKFAYTKGIIDEIFDKDIRRNCKVRNRDAFGRVMRYVMNNFGQTFSVRNVCDYFRNEEKTGMSQDTVRRYISVLVSAKILHEVPRFDCKSRKSLANLQKFYLTDLSLYFMNNTDARINYGPVLENLVFLHLREHGFSVSVGKVGDLECDFIARRGFDDYTYIQVSQSIADGRVEEREYAVFAKIRDGYPRMLLTLDALLQSRDGVAHKNLIEFLLKDGGDLC